VLILYFKTAYGTGIIKGAMLLPQESFYRQVLLVHGGY